MKKDLKYLFLITARGGSKGLPGKNIKELCGKPLIAWTIEAALACKYCEEVIVSTDSEEIAEVSRKYGASVPFMRPKELATDESPSIDAILHAIDFMESKGNTYDVLVLLEPTSPLRKMDDLKNALNLFEDNYDETDSVISVGEVHLENPYITKTIGSDGKLRNLIDGGNITRRQEYPKVYFPYGVLYATKINFLKSKRKVYSDNALPYLIERWQNYEVDDEIDFTAINAILKSKTVI